MRDSARTERIEVIRRGETTASRGLGHLQEERQCPEYNSPRPVTRSSTRKEKSGKRGRLWKRMQG